MTERKSSNSWLWILLGCMGVGVLGILGLGLGGYFLLKDSIALTPEQASEVQSSILPNATLPEGYGASKGFQAMGQKWVIIDGPDDHIILLWSGANRNFSYSQQTDGLQFSIKNGDLGFGSEHNLERLDSEVLDVGGTKVPFEKRRVNGEAPTRVFYLGKLPKKHANGNPIKVMFIGPEDTFDRSSMEAFLASTQGQAESGKRP